MDPQQQQPQYRPSFGQEPVHSNPVTSTTVSHNTNTPHSPLPSSSHLGDKIEQIIMLTYLFVAALLAFRFALGLFGARQTPFVDFVRDITIPFMLPFEGMFGTTPAVGYYSIEFEVIVAIIVYALVFFGLGRFVKILLK